MVFQASGSIRSIMQALCPAVMAASRLKFTRWHLDFHHHATVRHHHGAHRAVNRR
jgi:hypothetical protein